MNYKEIKNVCDEKIKDFPEYKERYKKEISALKRFYNADRDFYQELLNKKDKIDNRYVIPFLLGFTQNVKIEKPLDMVQVTLGASGGVDIDSDMQPLAKEKVFEYLKQKFGDERVLSVGTYTKMGVASAAKDLMRIYEVPFRESNALTSELDSQETWEQNLERLKFSRPDLYSTYEKYKDILDLVPYFINKIRQTGKHAGGVVVLDRPVYELIPVDRVSGNLVTAWPESGSSQVLDENGIIKLDILGISILDVIANTIDNINEKMYLIEDDDGVQKIVPQSYVDEVIEKI